MSRPSSAPRGTRWRRPCLAACLALLVSTTRGEPPPGTPPVGPDAAPSATTPVEAVIVSAPEPRYVAPTTRDRIGRIWAPVLINGQGPYRLVLDTGASHSALTRKVVDELRLPERANAVKLHGVTGSAVASVARVDSLQFGELRVENAALPIVADAFGGAQGVLGGDGLEDKRIVIEFGHDRISIMRSHREVAPSGYTVVPFRYAKARGMRVEVWVGRVRAVALIDTGGQATVGNLALRDALARRKAEPGETDDAIIGVTEDVQKTASARIPSIVVGTLIVRNAPIMFGDLEIFGHWHLDSEPALIIGMDVLGVLDTLVIDYRRNELHVKARS